MVQLRINGQTHDIDADPATPLLYVLRGDLGLNAAKFGCGLGQCGACTVLIDGAAAFSCVRPIGTLGGREITTLEALGSVDNPSTLQRAFIEEQAAQCGYCTAGMIMRAAALLRANPAPSDAEIRDHMQTNLCRCGTHMRILRAVKRASGTKVGAANPARGSGP